ncbi:MAG: hypothetical protein QOJ59_3344 [Thermomicrobiales bacterium]|jgi:hypothetical protein|nr:hypothetical protein [Thermomicrobiales bacterium]
MNRKRLNDVEPVYLVVAGTTVVLVLLLVLLLF